MKNKRPAWESVTNEDVRNVMRVLDLKKVQAEPLYLKLPRAERLVFDFAKYMMTSKIWQTLDDSAYHLVPYSSYQKVVFSDLVEVVQYYGCRQPIKADEKKLVQLLSGCTEEFRRFYMGILARQDWLKGVLTTLYVRCMKSSVSTQDIYPFLEPYWIGGGEGVIGLIENIWEEEGVFKGYNVWHGGKLRQCSCKLPSYSLLAYQEIVKNVSVRFSLETERVQEILFGMRPFRFSKRIELVDGTLIRMEKCLRCLRADRGHSYRGFCEDCRQAFTCRLRRYGPDVWIPPRKKIEKRWLAERWDWRIADSVRLRVLGYTVRWREDGAIMFVKETADGEGIEGQG